MTSASSGRALLALALAGAPRLGSGGDLRVTPSMSFSQMYDDNLFATPAAEADDISRLGAGFAVAQRSARLTLKARYGLEAEKFRRHPELDRVAARQDAALGIEWTASNRLGVALSAEYVDTRTPSELDVLTGVEVGRRRGRRLSTGALLTHRLGPRTSSRLEHRFNRDRVAGLPGSDAHDVILGLDRRLGPSDAGSAGYRTQRLAFGPEATVSHILTLGWKRAVSSSARFDLEAGPRWTGGRIGAEVSAGLRYERRHGHAAIDFTHGQTIVLGHAGPVTVQGVRASLSRRLVGPVWIGAAPGVFRVLGRGSEDSTLYGVASELAWRVTRSVTLSGTHRYGRQEGGLGQGSASELTHNTFALALTRRSPGE